MAHISATQDSLKYIATPLSHKLAKLIAWGSLPQFTGELVPPFAQIFPSILFLPLAIIAAGSTFSFLKLLDCPCHVRVRDPEPTEISHSRSVYTSVHARSIHQLLRPTQQTNFLLELISAPHMVETYASLSFSLSFAAQSQLTDFATFTTSRKRHRI